MALSRDEEKPWKTDLARKSAQRREQVLHEVEEVIKKAPSFEEALRQSVELMKKKFGRYSAITAYVADGEDLTRVALACGFYDHSHFTNAFRREFTRRRDLCCGKKSEVPFRMRSCLAKRTVL